jgi:hypothetical protein
MPLQDRIMELLERDEVTSPTDVLRALHLVVERIHMDLRADLRMARQEATKLHNDLVDARRLSPPREGRKEEEEGK